MAEWVYEVQVLGRVPEDSLTRLRDDFDGEVVAVESASTVLTGTVPDQAALVGMLDRIHALGLQVQELRRTPRADAARASEPSTRTSPASPASEAAQS